MQVVTSVAAELGEANSSCKLPVRAGVARRRSVQVSGRGQRLRGRLLHAPNISRTQGMSLAGGCFQSSAHAGRSGRWRPASAALGSLPQRLLARQAVLQWPGLQGIEMPRSGASLEILTQAGIGTTQFQVRVRHDAPNLRADSRSLNGFMNRAGLRRGPSRDWVATEAGCTRQGKIPLPALVWRLCGEPPARQGPAPSLKV